MAIDLGKRPLLVDCSEGPAAGSVARPPHETSRTLWHLSAPSRAKVRWALPQAGGWRGRCVRTGGPALIGNACLVHRHDQGATETRWVCQLLLLLLFLLNNEDRLVGERSLCALLSLR